MSPFRNGPADDVRLLLRRAPLLLRVVHFAAAGDGPRAERWAALDQVDDHPGVDETITVYVRTSRIQPVHVHRHGWFQQANYELAPFQPDDSDLRTNSAWQKWSSTMAPLLTPLTAYPPARAAVGGAR